MLNSKFAFFIVTALALSTSACTVRGGGKAGRSTYASDDRHGVSAGWESLGRRTVDGRHDRDSMFAARQGKFDQLMFRVSRSDVAIRDVVVVFGNGTTFSPGTQLVFDQGSNSRVIDLPGDTRTIQRIDFRYGNLPGSGRADVEVFGR